MPLTIIKKKHKFWNFLTSVGFTCFKREKGQLLLDIFELHKKKSHHLFERRNFEQIYFKGPFNNL